MHEEVFEELSALEVIEQRLRSELGKQYVFFLFASVFGVFAVFTWLMPVGGFLVLKVAIEDQIGSHWSVLLLGLLSISSIAYSATKIYNMFRIITMRGQCSSSRTMLSELLRGVDYDAE
jgi:hypothetical protein